MFASRYFFFGKLSFRTLLFRFELTGFLTTFTSICVLTILEQFGRLYIQWNTILDAWYTVAFHCDWYIRLTGFQSKLETRVKVLLKVLPNFLSHIESVYSKSTNLLLVARHKTYAFLFYRNRISKLFSRSCLEEHEFPWMQFTGISPFGRCGKLTCKWLPFLALWRHDTWGYFFLP